MARPRQYQARRPHEIFTEEPLTFTAADIAEYLDGCGRPRMADFVRVIARSNQSDVLARREIEQKYAALLARVGGAEPSRERAVYKSEWE